jgi:hypothetical protein
MFANATHVFWIIVGAYVGDVANALTAAKDIVKAPGLVKVGRMQGKPTRREAWHLAQKIGFVRVAGITHTGPHPVAPIQQTADDPTTDKACRAGNCHRTALWNWCHEILSLFES